MSKSTLKDLKRARIPVSKVGNTIVVHDTSLQEHFDAELRDLSEENERLRQILLESERSHRVTLDQAAELQRKLDKRNKLLTNLRKYVMVGI